MIRRLLIAALFLVQPLTGSAYETDQFSNRVEDISDSLTLLDQQVNQSIEKIATNWRGRRNDKKFMNAVYHDIGGHHWVDKLERWVMKSPQIERLSTPRRESIYSGHPLYATRVAAWFGVGPTIKINGVLVGSDKLGHFLSQGRKFYKRYLRSGDETLAANQSAYTERAIFGQMTTGSYSNADLVANFEGHLFYRSLFEDDITPGKPSILKWKDDGWVIQRPFTWADHVNDYWDEALNINHYDRLLYPHMKARLQTFCGDYQAQPVIYQVHDETALRQRYAHLQLRETSELRLTNLCPAPAVGSTQVTAFSH
jgi:hypothetical protein